jgi:hemerythrin-like domain-containing protein
MQAFTNLREDHRKVADLFSQVEETQSEKQQLRLFEEIQAELEVHTHIEETVLYPALQQYEKLKDYVLEALEEHKQVKTLLREIDRLSDGSERLDAKLKVMKENVEHHVEEEENEFFPEAQRLLSQAELTQLEEEMEAARKKFQRSSPARSGAR